jgi:DNA polymerase-3 subunit gamma/tau
MHIYFMDQEVLVKLPLLVFWQKQLIGKCEKCKLIETGKTLDIIEIDAASHTQVENIREIIIEKANFTPTSLKYKVYIIDEAHMLSKSSFNALLKTLEEPPEHAVFILATTEIHKIIPTIQSRCQRFDFHRIDDISMLERLSYIAKQEKIEINTKSLEMIVRASEGGFRDAISLLDQANDFANGIINEDILASVLGIADFALVEDFVYALSTKNAESGLNILHKAIDNGYEPSQFYKNTLEVFRRLLFASVSGVETLGLGDTATKMFTEILKGLTPTEILRITDIFIQTEQLYKSSILPQLSLEISTIKVCLAEQNLAVNVELPSSNIKASHQPYQDKKPSENNVQINKRANSTNSSNIKDGTKWQQLLMEVKAKNTSVHAILRVCEPDIYGNEICLTFPYKFHKERIEDIKNRELVEDSLSHVFGEKYTIRCVLSKVTHTEDLLQSTKNTKDDLLDDALEIFGGEVSE